MNKEIKCPVVGVSGNRSSVGAVANQHWWPNQLNLRILGQNSASTNPLGNDFDYAKEFSRLDLIELKKLAITIFLITFITINIVYIYYS